MEPSLPEPAPLFDAVGRVAVAWSGLEADLGRLLVALMHTPMAELLSVGQPFEVVRSHIKAVVDLPGALEQYDTPRERLSDEQRRRLGDVVKQSKMLADRRNRIVHGQWMRIGSEWSNFKPTRHQLWMQSHRVTIEEMHQLVREIDELSDRIGQLGANIDHRLYGLPAPPDLDE